jgi:hypothetical protein
MFQTLSPRAGDAIHPVLLGRVWLVLQSAYGPSNRFDRVILHSQTLYPKEGGGAQVGMS